jgi:hypothetical protein|eukprot:scaffold4487_cov273-Chaetoceros_neogracile.AAC.60
MGDGSSRPVGPLGIDPLYFALVMFGCLLLFVTCLLLPRGIRFQYFAAYPKRYAWSAKPRRLRRVSLGTLCDIVHEGILKISD